MSVLCIVERYDTAKNSGITGSWARDKTCLLTVYNQLLHRFMEDLGLLTASLRTCLINTNGDCLGSRRSLGQSWDGHCHLNAPDQSLWKVVYSRPVHECSDWQFSSLSWLCHGDRTVFYVIRTHGRNDFSPCIPLLVLLLLNFPHSNKKCGPLCL